MRDVGGDETGGAGEDAARGEAVVGRQMRVRVRCGDGRGTAR